MDQQEGETVSEVLEDQVFEVKIEVFHLSCCVPWKQMRLRAVEMVAREERRLRLSQMHEISSAFRNEKKRGEEDEPSLFHHAC